MAERLELAAMTPCEHLTSTGYCLADPGRQYVIYLPEGGRVEVDLSAAAEPLAVEWIAPIAGTSHAGKPAAGGAKRQSAGAVPRSGSALAGNGEASGSMIACRRIRPHRYRTGWERRTER